MGTYSDNVPPRNKRGMRTGYTTGSTAAAAARAATIALLTGIWPPTVTISLPIGETATMTPVECALQIDQDAPEHTADGAPYTNGTTPGRIVAASCCVVKDAGDDPDVTHGALICAHVRRTEQPGIVLEGGIGVGRVTLPGLGLPVGGPAINATPRQQIVANVIDAVGEFAPQGAAFLEQQGLKIIMSVPDGERLAQKTLNPRLGIIGGISILGTTGKVFPYSTAAWRDSVVKAVEVAAASGTTHVVLATGGRSERFAMQMFPTLPAVAFVELSAFTDSALKACMDCGIMQVTLVAMISRVAKFAQGHLMTHVSGSQVDLDFLAQVCQDTGAPDELVAAVAMANTARHMLELCQAHGCRAPLQHLTDLALHHCQQFVIDNGSILDLTVILVDFDGTVLARSGISEH